MKRNEIVIDCRVLKLGALRHTPAGMPAIDLVLAHRSVQVEAGRRRQVQCELDAVMLGDAAVGATRLGRNQALRVNGFLARRSAGNRHLVLHVIGAQAIDDDDEPNSALRRRK